MAPLRIYLSSFLLLVGLSKIYGKRDFLILLDTCSTTCNTSYVDTCYCRVNKTFSPPRGFAYFRYIRQADELQFSFDISLLRKNNERYTLINSTNNDGCAFLEGKHVQPLVKIYRDNLIQFGNLPKRCPIEKGYEFVFKDMVFDAERLPPYVPEARFCMNLTYYLKDEHMFTVLAEADVVQTGSKGWLSRRGRDVFFFK